MVDEYVENQLDQLNISGAVLVIIEDHEIALLQRIWKSNSADESLLVETPIFIGSLTKSITSTAM